MSRKAERNMGNGGREPLQPDGDLYVAPPTTRSRFALQDMDGNYVERPMLTPDQLTPRSFEENMAAAYRYHTPQQPKIPDGTFNHQVAQTVAQARRNGNGSGK